MVIFSKDLLTMDIYFLPLPARVLIFNLKNNETTIKPQPAPNGKEY